MFRVRLACGCCREDLDITPEEAQRLEQWMATHQGSSVTVSYEDRLGKPHVLDRVDTFYGLWDAAAPEHNLGHLAAQLKPVMPMVDEQSAAMIRDAWYRLGGMRLDIAEVIERMDGQETRSLCLVTPGGGVTFVTPFEDWVDGHLTLWGPRLHLDHKEDEKTIVPFETCPPHWAQGEREITLSELAGILHSHIIVDMKRERRPGHPLVIELDDHIVLRFRMTEPEGDVPRRIYATRTVPQSLMSKA